jgi:hypothetical protein
MEQKFVVGQVVFMYVESEQKILAAQIVEEVVRTRLGTFSKSLVYYVKFVGNDQKFVLSSKQKVFSKIEEAQMYLFNNAKRVISEICLEAMNESKKFNQNQIEKKISLKKDDDLDEDLEESKEESSISVHEVQLPDGQIVNARIAMPSGLVKQHMPKDHSISA